MLKIKKSNIFGKKKSEAYKEVQKDDKTKGLYAKIPENLHYKLKKKLVESKKTYTEWLIEKIEDM